MTKPRSRFPYYKVQSYSEQQCSWINDRKEAFNSHEEALAYIQQHPRQSQFRILIVEARGRRVLGTTDISSFSGPAFSKS
jgi:hypothetical protein